MGLPGHSAGVRISFVVVVLAAAAGCGNNSQGQPAGQGGRDEGLTASTATSSVPVSSAMTSTASAEPAAQAGERLYGRYCVLCHGKGATGYAADNAPSLVNPTFLESADDRFLLSSIALGRPGTAMAPYRNDRGGPLAGADIARIISYLRSLGPAARPVPAVAKGDAARGAPLYAERCQKCHGDPTTRGVAPHLANSEFLAAASDGFIAHAIRQGRPGTLMESFARVLTEEQVADVVAHLRSWARPMPVAAAVTPGQKPTGKEPLVINPGGKAPSFTLRDGRFVPAVQVRDALAQKRRIILIDARPESEWIRMRIPGSVAIPHYDTARIDQIPNDGTWIVAYCACPHHASGMVVDELRKRGHLHTAVLDEGILKWRTFGYPVEGEAPFMPPASDAHGHGPEPHSHGPAPQILPTH
jgi:mono/diheme cytochrome c family protein/rhodanese-related sulfurtransferase